MRVEPIHVLQPPPHRAQAVASLPYDVGDLEDARREAEQNPSSFLHVERPEVDLPRHFDAASGIHHETARRNLARMRERGDLRPAGAPGLFVYRITLGCHSQTGVVGGCHVEDYYADIIKKHEKTKKPTEDDRTRHVLHVGAHTGPIFLLYRDRPEIDALVDAETQRPAEIDFVAADGIRHQIWPVRAVDAIRKAFSTVPVAYVADGHHRAAAAARAGRERAAANPAHRGDEPYNWILAVLFPASQLRILPYNRVVVDLNGRSKAQFLEEVRSRFVLQETRSEAPSAPGRVHMRLDGRWFELSWPEEPAADPVSRLDVSVLQEKLLGPVLGIDDPRTNSRIEYIGGLRSAEEVRERVDSGRAAVGFSMYPTTVDQLMAISDAGKIMPPKSTWFEPKLRSGLFVHPLD